jgi:predicted permease
MSWFSRLHHALRPRRLDDELNAELHDHLERRAADLRAAGADPAEATREARRMFGNFTAIREQSRDVRMGTALASVLQDARYACRGMGRSPVFTATAVLSLSLAIGATAAIYSIIDAAMLRPLPVPEPERLFTLATPDLRQPGSTTGERDTFSYPLFQDLRAVAGNSASLAVFAPPGRSEVQTLDPNAPVDLAMTQHVSGEAFQMLRVPPALGRAFSSEEDGAPGAHAFVVLSYDYWQRRFHGDPAVLGQVLRIGIPFRIVGVAAKGFYGIEPGKFVDIWIPATMSDPDALKSRTFQWAHIAGRLHGSMTTAALEVRLQTTDRTLRVHPGAVGVSGFRRAFSRPLWIVMGVAAGILLIACSNVASLLLARATRRSAEMAIRISIGAGRARLARQLFTENLLLSALGGLGGWIVARIAAPTLVEMLSTGHDPVRFALSLDTRVLLFCAAVCAFSGLLFGLLPAWQTAGAHPMIALRYGTAPRGKLRAGRFFVGVQVAFAFCLVVAGAGFLFSLKRLASVDTGFDPRGVTVLTLSFKDWLSLPHQQALQTQIASRPQIQGVAIGWHAIFTGARRADRIVLPGRAASEREEIMYRVSPGYLAAVHTPLLDGRDLTFQDNDGGQPIPTVINLAFARRYFGDESVVGREFKRTDGARHLIVGLAANSYYGDLRNGPEPVVYFPMKPTRRFVMYVRSTLDGGSLVHVVESEAGTFASGTHVIEATRLETLVGTSILTERLLAGIGGSLAALGLVLAAIGMFGLLNYSVASRAKEISIRAALGARRPQLVTLVLADLFRMIAAGVIAGLIAAVAFLRMARSLLFGVQPADPWVIGSAVAVFLLAALIAGGLPARRAALLDPIVALRQE